MDWPLLRAVSRSFYLTIRLLPARVREPIALGYLLARASDSIADTSSADVSMRLDLLEALKQGHVDPGALVECAGRQANPDEAELIRRLPELLTALLASPSRARIEWVWERILTGQMFDLTRFSPGAGPLSAEGLDEYTYLVAGCVGEFWTRLCADLLRDFSPEGAEALVPDAIRYGKGLQLVNILRDRRADEANGRIYVPRERFDETKALARSHLEAGGRWVRAVRNGRVRFACLPPLLIGRETLDLLEVDSGPVKISRRDVRRVLMRSVPALWSRNVG